MKAKVLTFKRGMPMVLLAALVVAMAIFIYARSRVQDGEKYLTASQNVAATSPDDILVSINDHKITRSDVDREIATIFGLQLQMLTPDQRTKAYEQLTPKILDHLVLRTLLARASDDENITVKDEEINKSLEQIKTDKGRPGSD